MKDELPTAHVDSAEPDSNKRDGADAKQAAAHKFRRLTGLALRHACRIGPHLWSAGQLLLEPDLAGKPVRVPRREPAGALGIAQFMPRTAAAVGLTDPLDPLKALPASARLLVAYQRLAISDWRRQPIIGRSSREQLAVQQIGLPQETRNYVLAITGLPVEHWKAAAKGLQSFKLAKRMPCHDHEAFAEAGEAIVEASA